MRINLLPWREWEQRRRRQHFAFGLVIALLVGIVIVYWGWLMANGALSAQKSRNAYLRREIAQLNHKIKDINALKKTRSDLLARMRVIERLEQSRPLAVHLFDQLASTVPNDVYLTSVKNRDGHLSIKGIASSPSGVSNYMRNIDHSPWLDTPNLQVVRTHRRGGAWQSSFSVTTKLVPPGNKSSGGGKSGKEARP